MTFDVDQTSLPSILFSSRHEFIDKRLSSQCAPVVSWRFEGFVIIRDCPKPLLWPRRGVGARGRPLLICLPVQFAAPSPSPSPSVGWRSRPCPVSSSAVLSGIAGLARRAAVACTVRGSAPRPGVCSVALQRLAPLLRPALRYKASRRRSFLAGGARLPSSPVCACVRSLFNSPVFRPPSHRARRTGNCSMVIHT